MIAKLVVIGGKTSKRLVDLALPTVLGRSREADVTVAHPLISRRHCEMFEQDGLLMLRDLASLNGTMVGGRRIELAPLLPEGEFTIGPLSFRILYRYDGDPHAVPAIQYSPVGDPAVADGNNAVPTVRGVEADADMQFDEALASDPVAEQLSVQMEMRDFLAMADADPLALLPSPPPTSRPSANRPSANRESSSTQTPLARQTPVVPPKQSPAPSWPPVARDKLPTVPMPDASMGRNWLSDSHEIDPAHEIDPVLGFGVPAAASHSPWATESPSREVPPVGSVPEAPPTVAPPIGAANSTGQEKNLDPEFEKYLEGLD